MVWSSIPQSWRNLGVMLALSLGPLVSTSFARFAYALILPAMRSELGLTFSQAGSLNTANALGYLIGALIAVGCVSRWGNRRLFCIGMILTVFALLGCALTEDFVMQLSLRTLVGVCGALVFICGVVLASNLFPERAELSAVAVAVYFGGAGAGIVLSAAAIPWLLATLGSGAWREAWLAIAILSALFTVFSVSAARRVEDPATSTVKAAWQARAFLPALASYFLFGFGYIGYMTFVVASMVAKGASQLDVALTWGTLDVATMLAPLAWRAPRSRWYASKMLAAIGIVLSVGAAIPLYSTSRAAMIVSAFLFGIAMFSVPASVTDIVKTSLPKPAWSSAVAFFTVLFAAGQIMGPLFTGWLADATQSLNGGLAGSTCVLLAASVVAMCQREPIAFVRRRQDGAGSATPRRPALALPRK